MWEKSGGRQNPKNVNGREMAIKRPSTKRQKTGAFKGPLK